MDITHDKNFDKILNTLNDIIALGSSELRPCISQLEFYLNALKYDTNNFKHSGGYLNDFLLNFIEKEFTDYFLQKSNGAKSLELNLNVKKLSFERWGYILDVVPLVISFLNQFDFDETITLIIDDNNLVISSKFMTPDKLLTKRTDIYYLSRCLIKKKVIPTFKVSDDNVLNLIFDLSFDPQIFYCFDFSAKQNIILKMTNILKSYQSNFTKEICEKRHLCVVVKDDLTVEKYYRIPQAITSKDCHKDCQLFHFSFLFRPVSLIILSKGFLTTEIGIRQFMETLTKNLKQNLEQTGSLKKQKEQQNELSTKHEASKKATNEIQCVTVHNLDFFSLLV